MEGGAGHAKNPIDIAVIYQVESSKLLTYLAFALASFLPQIELLTVLMIGTAVHPPPLPLTLVLLAASDFLTIYFAFGAVVRYDLLAAIEAKFAYAQVNALVAADPKDPRSEGHRLARVLLKREQQWFRIRYRWLFPLVGIPLLVLVVTTEILRFCIWGSG